MCGCRFLLSLREPYNWGRILQCRSFIKENINLWEEDLIPAKQPRSCHCNSENMIYMIEICFKILKTGDV